MWWDWQCLRIKATVDMRIILCCSAAVMFSTVAIAQEVTSPALSWLHSFYVGAEAGYGSTTWEGLVPQEENLNAGMRTSTPILVTEGGVLWGFVAGYEFSRHLALEASYTQYPKATVSFDEESIFTFENDGLVDLYTNTNAISLMAKVMLDVPRTRLRGYSSFGVAQIHREDQLNDAYQTSPTFGVGFVYDASAHIMIELGFNYTAGYGQSEMNPAIDYIPFLYSGFGRLSYKF